MEVLLVGLGGIIGSLTRFILGRQISKRSASSFPWPTFLINISGAILLGMVTGIDPHRNIYLFLADGFLGAYTTFSTFMYEGFSIFSNRKSLNACTYILGSIIIGIAGYFVGFFFTNKI